MARFGLAALWFRGGARMALGFGLLARGGALLALGFGLLGCRGAESEQARIATRGEDPSLPCDEDEVREYFCDDLLPLFSSRPAAEPYTNCPATSDVRNGSFPALGRIAAFDPALTAYTRQRVPPGHSCCFGWCAKVTVSDPSRAAPSTCSDSSGLYESFCMRELEQGTSKPAQSPFEHCPVALKPPEVLSFAAPASALLDVRYTAQRRRDMLLADCCYGWCSKTPSGTVLKTTHPKIK